MTTPYEGIRIIDFTQLEQGPAGTQVLADFGAEVIKVERIDTGETGRANKFPVNGVSLYWASCNRNKKSLSLDLKQPEARQIVLDLVKVSDVVASNFRPGVMERLGLGYEELSRINPRIICAYASGYGQTGPYRDRRGQDLLAQALGGAMTMTGHSEGPPTATGFFLADYLGAMLFAQGIMLALAARDRTGEGQMVDTCLLNAMIASHLQEATTYQNLGLTFSRPRPGLAHAYQGPLYGTFRASDGKWLVFTGGFVDRPWQRVCAALEIGAEVAADPRLQTREGLLDHEEEVLPVVTQAVASKTREEVLRRLEDQDISCAPVNEYPDLFADPQVIHNEMIMEMDSPAGGTLKTVGIPLKLSKTPGRLRLRPPRVGEHNTEIMTLLGYPADRIQSLRDRGVVGEENVTTASEAKANGSKKADLEAARWQETAPYW